MEIAWGDIKKRIRNLLDQQGQVDKYSKNHSDDYIVEFPYAKEEEIEFFIMDDKGPLAITYPQTATSCSVWCGLPKGVDEWHDFVEEKYLNGVDIFK